MQPEVVNRLQHAVLEGEFDEALAVLPELTKNETTVLQVVLFLRVNKPSPRQEFEVDVSGAGPISHPAAEVRRAGESRGHDGCYTNAAPRVGASAGQ